MKVLMLHGMPSARETQATPSLAPPVIHGVAYGVGLSALIWAIIAMIVVGII